MAMADQQGGDARVTNLTPEDVARGLTEGRLLLVDVREPNEVAIERYPDALVVPLSSFDPAAIPDPQGRQVVFACRSGRRSVTASLACSGARLSLCGTSRRRHPGMESCGLADRDLIARAVSRWTRSISCAVRWSRSALPYLHHS
jgi:rhodanese-related sulfurtransferase